MKRVLLSALAVGLVGFTGYWTLTAPAVWAAFHPTRDVAEVGHTPDLANGESLFYAGACGTCHATPGQSEETRLGGGLKLASDFGTFSMPNISPDRTNGIGGWTAAQFVTSMRTGTSEKGHNQYPAFPYTSFQRMTANDLGDLFAYLKTLPAVAEKAPGHELKFPFTMVRGIGLWKLAFLDGKPLVDDASKSPAWNRGRYLVEGPAHCAECHSPRNVAGAVDFDKRFAGAPDPEGHGYVPNITADETGIGYWSAREIADYLGTGMTPIGTQAGGSMAPIVANLAHLSAGDRLAMGEYIKSLATIVNPAPGMPELNRTATVRILSASAETVSSSHRLAVAGDALTETTMLYAVGIKPFFLDRTAAGTAGAADGGDGRLLPAAAMTVLARDGAFLQVRIDGWQQKGSEAAFYALQGQRIQVAALSPAAVSKVTNGRTVEDPATKLTWLEGSITAWVADDDLSPDLAKIWGATHVLYAASCGTCHSLHPTDGILANQWIGSLSTMKRFTSLKDEDYRMILAYLQFHSKDVKTTDESKLPGGTAP